MREGRAKEFGICPIRRHLYDQLFDELIRQVTVNCAERGLLLLRVKDEIRMTLLAYQSLLESAIAYGLRKAIIVEKEQSQAAIERDEEKGKNKTLMAKIAQLEKQIVNEKIMNEDELETLEERMREENERLLESNKVLKNQLQAILQMDKMAGAEIPIESSEKKN
ncbi:hypothetical protein PMAYCL1PPCAC_02497 [Pristionchus mayeri]|uniref:Uncharacterized protein n=1 Tax=Pristionchus mayeri TaxID=1317129 RepID=A0AAN4Z0H4_9BILA|nr:hypothetical protein PMAYCL1PPCAC_02497 [Pristionchus mayeri]